MVSRNLRTFIPTISSPDYSVVERLGISQGEKFIIVRFISWAASHDVSLHGHTPGQRN